MRLRFMLVLCLIGFLVTATADRRDQDGISMLHESWESIASVQEWVGTQCDLVTSPSDRFPNRESRLPCWLRRKIGCPTCRCETVRDWIQAITGVDPGPIPEKYRIANRQEEGSCCFCGYPLFVDDEAFD